MTLVSARAISPESVPRGGKGYGILVVIISVGYGLWLAGLPLLEFKDRENYLRYAQASGTISDRYLADGWRAFVFNEPVWLAINDVLARFFDPVTVLWLIILVPAATVAWVILSRGPKHFVYLVFLLFVPFVIKNHIIHLRQGVAIALFFLALRVPNRPLRWLLLALTPLIHSSFFVILFLYLLSRVVARMSGRSTTAVGLLVVASLIGMTAFSSVATWSGARQAESIEAASGDVTGLGFALWLLVLIVFFSEGGAFIRKNLFPITVLLFYMCSYFFTEQAGRILESGVLAVFFAALSLTRLRYAVFVLAILAYTVVSYWIRVDAPWFGWGI